MTKRLLFSAISLLLMVTILSGCIGSSKMPFNGDITFNEITLTIPERFIRDSTQSNDDLWVFEHDNYSEMILISRSEIVGDVTLSLETYIDYMKEKDAESSMTTFLDKDAVFSSYYIDDVFCQEILFPHNDHFYAVALRGGTEEGFEEISKTVAIIA